MRLFTSVFLDFFTAFFYCQRLIMKPLDDVNNWMPFAVWLFIVIFLFSDDIHCYY